MNTAIRLIIVSILSWVPQPPPGQNAPPSPPSAPLIRENATVKLTDHVWAIPDFNVGMVPNVGIIVGSTATLVVDTGLGPRNGEAVLRETALVSKNAKLYLMATHFHPEHAAGSSAFPPATTFL